jgi:5'-deoxynucleotidase YfbR-like HD superfamily hydrolase
VTQVNTERACITTFTGKRFYLLEPVIEDIDIRDIAHSLSMQCRWTGHSKFHYSVAQHCYYCSFLGSKKEAFDRLMHDASESYLSDISRPLKHYTDVGTMYRLQERIIQNAIRHRFGLGKEPKSVHEADNQMLFAEKKQIMGDPDWDESLEIHTNYGTASINIKKWSPEYAERMFLKRFKQLYKGKA